MRTTPFDIAFGAEAEEWFPRIRASLASTGLDPHDADAFILDREVVLLLQSLMPDEGIGEAVQQHVALLHNAYLYWDAGGWIFSLTKARAAVLLEGPESSHPDNRTAPRAYYLQFPERMVWAELEPNEPPQPMDGMFVRPWPGGGYFVLAVFGMHPAHSGFSVADADGYLENELIRGDGSPAFAPLLPGGAAAGLHSIVGPEELLELAARTLPAVVGARDCATSAHVPHRPIVVS
jgi:hypothetical protein